MSTLKIKINKKLKIYDEPYQFPSILSYNDIYSNDNFINFFTDMISYSDLNSDACVLRVILLRSRDELESVGEYDKHDVSSEWRKLMYNEKSDNSPIRALQKNGKKYIEIYDSGEWIRYCLEDWYQIIHEYLLHFYQKYMHNILDTNLKINLLIGHYRKKIITYNKFYLQRLNTVFCRSIIQRFDINKIGR